MEWEDYLAPADLEEDLRSIADDLDPARQNSIQKSAEKIYGAAAVEVPGFLSSSFTDHRGRERFTG